MKEDLSYFQQNADAFNPKAHTIAPDAEVDVHAWDLRLLDFLTTPSEVGYAPLDLIKGLGATFYLTFRFYCEMLKFIDFPQQ
jgi:hypothetical protein